MNVTSRNLFTPMCTDTWLDVNEPICTKNILIWSGSFSVKSQWTLMKYCKTNRRNEITSIKPIVCKKFGFEFIDFPFALLRCSLSRHFSFDCCCQNDSRDEKRRRQICLSFRSHSKAWKHASKVPLKFEWSKLYYAAIAHVQTKGLIFL